MAIKLMYITNKAEIAQIAENVGVDRIFVDLETVGKQARQGGMDTVQSHHSLDDIAEIKSVLKTAELLVRSNPIYENSENEIETIVKNGADIVMLPYFKTCGEVLKFLELVGGRARTCLLFETPEAVEKADEIIELPGVDEVFIGLNDLSLGYGKKFMFELLTDGTVERLSEKFKKKDIPFGFGGIAALGCGMLPSEYIICEHYRLGSGAAILSRSFCNCDKISDLSEIQKIFVGGLAQIRSFEKRCALYNAAAFADNYREIQRRVKIICEDIK